MKIKILTILSIVIMAPVIRAQISLDSLIQMAERNNPEILAAYQYYENTRVGSKTNLFPDNPEIEYAYLWGSPRSHVNRRDLSVSQYLDFPTVYTNRSKLSHTGVEKARQIYQSIRQDVLLKAQQKWIEKVFLNKRKGVLDRRMEEVLHVLDYLQSQYDHGEISKLGLNRAILLKASLTAVMDDIMTDMSSRQIEISYMTGGSAVLLEDTEYYPVEAILIDSVLQVSLSDPLYKAYQYDVESLNIRKKLARASGMPKFKTGYYSESITDENLRGIQLGLSIPLWENANKVKHAEGEILSAEMELGKFRSLEEAKIIKLHGRMESRRNQMQQLQDALQSTNVPGLLAVAMERGEISMMEYYFGTELYYRVLEEYLAAEKDFYLAEAELTRYGL